MKNTHVAIACDTVKTSRVNISHNAIQPRQFNNKTTKG